MSFIPRKALQQHIAILGKNGSGKTYTAKGIVEGMLDSKERVCIIDPTDVWWGLKSGYPVIVFGGKKADLPLGPNHGETLAEAIGTSSTPAIIVTADLRTGERTRFFTDFAEGLLRKNKGPLHLIIDEAHIFAPQGKVPDPQSGAMLHAANNLVSLGRARGLRITMITQRPAKLHKDSLSQVETLIAMRLIAPQDRAAVQEWIKDQANVEEGKQIIASLPSLATGHGWIWAPEIGILKKVAFPKIKTFDSSRAPDAADSGKGPKLAPIDLEAIQGKLEAVVKEAATKDPVALQKRIRELETQIKKAPASAPDPKEIKAAHKSGYELGYEEGILETRNDLIENVKKLTDEIDKVLGKKIISKPKSIPALPPRVAMPSQAPIVRSPAILKAVNGSASRPQNRVIEALCFWASLGHEAPTRKQVGIVAGYSPNSGGFGNVLSQLHTSGMIRYPEAGRVTLTESAPTTFMVAAEAQRRLLSVLSGPQQTVLQAFENDEPYTREDIGKKSNYSPNSGGFGNILSQLTTLGVIERAGSGMVKISPWVREVLS